jgi:hypothetical protein
MKIALKDLYKSTRDIRIGDILQAKDDYFTILQVEPDRYASFLVDSSGKPVTGNRWRNAITFKDAMTGVYGPLNEYLVASLLDVGLNCVQVVNRDEGSNYTQAVHVRTEGMLLEYNGQELICAQVGMGTFTLFEWKPFLPNRYGDPVDLPSYNPTAERIMKMFGYTGDRNVDNVYYIGQHNKQD